ncbi:hypothetical protein MMC10_011145 [Thelotrema lepadinum]|nr:hypothetical protein [Thelotrema lepadinum]
MPRNKNKNKKKQNQNSGQNDQQRDMNRGSQGNRGGRGGRGGRGHGGGGLGRRALQASLIQVARSVVDRLPSELTRIIYGYTLIAEKPLAILPNRSNIARKIYAAQEPSKTATREFDHAMRFFVYKHPQPDNAHAYVFSHNTFEIASRKEAEALMSVFNGLAPAARPSSVYGIKVNVLNDPLSGDPKDKWWLEAAEWEDIEDRIYIPSLLQEFQMEDFDKNDGLHPGLRAYRILKPLLKHPYQLRYLDINLQQYWETRPIFVPPDIEMGTYDEKTGKHIEHAGLPMLAAVIGKLKDRLRSAKGQAITVPTTKADEVGYLSEIEFDERNERDDDELKGLHVNMLDKGTGPDAGGRPEERHLKVAIEVISEEGREIETADISWLWASPSEAEHACMGADSEPFRHTKDGLNRRYRLLYCYWKNPEIALEPGDPTDLPPPLHFEDEEYDEKVQDCDRALAVLQKNEMLWERCRVARLAADPKWEEKVETLAKQPREREYPEELERMRANCKSEVEAEKKRFEDPSELWRYNSDSNMYMENDSDDSELMRYKMTGDISQAWLDRQMRFSGYY